MYKIIDQRSELWILNSISGVTGGAQNEIDTTVYAYVVTINGRPGKINMEKCAALGIRPGPVIGMFKAF